MSTNILSPGNIARAAYEPSLEAIKVTVVGSGSPTTPNVVRLTDGIGYLTTTVSGPNRALDVNIINSLSISIDQSTDSIKIGDGTDLLAVNVDGSINTVVAGVSTSANQTTQITEAQATNTKLDSIYTELQQKTEPSDAQNIRSISSVTDSISVPGVASSANQLSQITEAQTTNTTLNSLLTELQQKTEPSDAQNIRTLDSGTDSIAVPGVATAGNQASQTTELININNTLDSIDTKLTSPLSVSIDNNVQITGTIDGTTSGTEYGFVYNLRQQILSSHDRQQEFTYADFGTKDQRITQVDYTSPTFPGVTARKTLTYLLEGNKYKRDTITWSII